MKGMRETILITNGIVDLSNTDTTRTGMRLEVGYCESVQWKTAVDNFIEQRQTRVLL